ncbi:MAG: hypothetical protein COT91_00270 [Candidatus Doudnabacteria bacterium CG10_big_fil_rev_8_21_14_0_10_41_10]|uniref:Uncharacterized protein n=1 Tax=Candidatus Doudnabacteria bacterium CG10_big_fil_rev_8_21_14_0_10_41_10 TaxID=1974551 RepID=A0A2H0VEX6_9BACT|nr:MAG: hypothetical protein COT91_00270 [Candidatus Doudnabacteria bacterium CG10_big_fil_rev_8_21_14_0_10_41_10]
MRDITQQKDKPKGGSPNKGFAIALIAGVILLAVGFTAWFLVSGGEFNGMTWMMFVVLGVIILAGVVAAVLALKQKEKREPDYYTFFVMGLIWTPVGLLLENMYAFTVMGVVFLIVGLANKDKWKNRRTWKDLTPTEKKFKYGAIIILGILVLAGLAVYYLNL